MTSIVQQKFGAAAKDYASSAVHAKGQTLARLVELTKPQSHWRVLDIATGAGHTALAFAPHVAKVTASDITDAMLAEARRLAKERKLGNVVTFRASAEDLPFPDGSFHLVTCRLAAHHFVAPEKFVHEAWRVLTPGGMFALVDNISPDASILPELDATTLRDCALAYNAFEKLRDPSHARCLALVEWIGLLTDAGFTVEHQEHIDQDIAFTPWVQRMRCDEATISSLKPMLQAEPLRSFLRPRETEQGLVFTLQECIVIARKLPLSPSGRGSG